MLGYKLDVSVDELMDKVVVMNHYLSDEAKSKGISYSLCTDGSGSSIELSGLALWCDVDDPRPLSECGSYFTQSVSDYCYSRVEELAKLAKPEPLWKEGYPLRDYTAREIAENLKSGKVSVKYLMEDPELIEVVIEELVNLG